MSNETSPRPWRVEENVVGWTSFIVDANGDGVAACWRTARGDDEKERQYNEANAALIVDAVNERAKFEEARMEFPDFRPVIIAAGQRDAAIAERDRLRDELACKTRNYEDVIAHHQRTEECLRDIVRRMMEKLAVLNAGYRLMLSEGPEDAEMADLCTRTEALVREARAALGEGAP